MKSFTLLDADEINSDPKAPRDHEGRFLPTDCHKCKCGKLRYQGRGFWSCDGLVDPDNNEAELQPCENFHYDGEEPQP